MSGRVQGDNNNFRPDEYKKEDKIDNPDEFNDLMKKKVEESDETEKQRKRPQTAQPEEEEGSEIAPEDQENPTAGAFASFMTEDEAQAPQEYQSFAPQSSDPTQNISQEEFENVDTSNIDQNATEITRQEALPPQEEPQQQFEPIENQAAPAQQEQTNGHDPAEKTTKADSKKTEPTKKTGQKKIGRGVKHEGEKPSLGTKKAESEKTKPIKETKTDDTRKTHDNEINAPIDDAKGVKNGENSKGEEEKKLGGAEKTKGAKESIPDAGPKKKTKEETKTKETDFGMQTGEITQTVKGSLPSASVTKLGPVASLKPEILHILQKAVLTIRVMKELGHEKTSVELHMPGSVLNGAKIDIAKYAEGTFNIQLSGDPEAVNLFEENRSQLEKALKDRGLDVTLESARLKEEKKAKTVTRKEEA